MEPPPVAAESESGPPGADGSRRGVRPAMPAQSAPSRFRLAHLTIRNFRGIRNLTLELDETTVLIGENNTGKTAVLQAIERCLSRPRQPAGRIFDEYDYHLEGVDASPEGADPILIELRFEEPEPEALPSELREDLGRILILREDDRRQATLRVTSRYDSVRSEFNTKSVFLDARGGSATPMTGGLAAAFRRVIQVHFLPALRDVGKHFGKRGPFWSDFLSAEDLDDADRQRFEKEVAVLNRQLIDSHPPLQEVRENLHRAAGVIGFGREEPVGVDALPTRASALLSQAQVNLSSRKGAKVPLDRQGEGARSLAVLLLFDAYLRRRLGKEGGTAAPITVLEEPEAHLHPAASRLLMEVVQRFPGQKVVSTHSGDLIGRLDPRSVRRLAYRDGEVQAYRADFDSMAEKDERTFRRAIRRGRGDLLFARCWLMYEGETEAVVFHGVAEVLGLDLDRHGVATLQCSEVSPGALFRIANQFGIPWYLVYDGDRGRRKYESPALENLDGATVGDRLLCPYPNIEQYLSENGFGDLYTGGRRKVAAAEAAVERMVSRAVPVPEVLKTIVEKAVALAEA